MWQSNIESLDDGRIQKYKLLRGDLPLPYADVLQSWRFNEEFRAFFIALLADSAFSAFRWETPAVTSADIDRDFEFVLLQSSALERRVDSGAFSSHFANSRDVVTFPNLGGDAVMVVPCPIDVEPIYGHLASFIRGAPQAQIHHLWESVGAAMQDRLGDRPVWLNTAGMGVSWLHIRLDSRPKYYAYAPYR